VVTVLWLKVMFFDWFLIRTHSPRASWKLLPVMTVFVAPSSQSRLSAPVNSRLRMMYQALLICTPREPDGPAITACSFGAD